MHAQAVAFCIIQSFLSNVGEKSSLLLLQKCCTGANPCNNPGLAVQCQLPAQRAPLGQSLAAVCVCPIRRSGLLCSDELIPVSASLTSA